MAPLITLYNLGEGEWESADFAAYKEIRETGNDAISMVICGVMAVEIATYTLALRSNMPTPIGDKRGCRLVNTSNNRQLEAYWNFGSMFSEPAQDSLGRRFSGIPAIPNPTEGRPASPFSSPNGDWNGDKTKHHV